MVIKSANARDIIQSAKELIDQEPMSPALKACLLSMMLMMELMANQLGLNSKNSSKPPSTDPNRKKKPKSDNPKKPGGQNGHIGKTLEKVENPNKIEFIPVDRTTLPSGTWTSDGYESRQVFDLEISVEVTEYRAEILKNETGDRYTAKFPEGVGSPVQYGNSVITHAVYLSQYQLVPYERVREHFADQFGVPVSVGTINNFNERVYEKLGWFDSFVKENLLAEKLLHADETGINIDGKGHWIHGNSSRKWTYLTVHGKRGKEAMDAMGVLSEYGGTVCHDHWKPYYRFDGFVHSLCNAHHLRELQHAYESGQDWAQNMQELLLEINKDRNDFNRILSPERIAMWHRKYRDILAQGELECPLPPVPAETKRGRVKQSKSRNLLDRLRDFEDDTLRFLNDPVYEFTNNEGEQTLRMTKVHQKISGCFKSFHGAEVYCRIRSYLSSAMKHGFTASYALQALFNGENIFTEKLA